MAQCTAKSKRTGERCKANAVTGSDKCYHHGGATPVKHGLYSKYSKAKLAGLVNELKDNPALTDIKEHVALMFALLLKKLETMQDEISDDDIHNLSNLAEKTTKAIERWYKVNYGVKYILQVEQVQVLVNQVVHIIREEVGDESIVKRIAARLLDISVPGYGGSN